MSKAFEVTYRWTPEVNRTFRHAVLWTGREKLRLHLNTLVMVGSIGALIALIAHLYDSGDFFTTWKLVCLGVVIGMVSGLINTLTDNVINDRRQNAALRVMSKFVLRVGPEGIVNSNDQSRTEYDWGAISDVADVKSGLAIIIKGWGFIPLLEAALPDGLTKAEALSRINTWRSA